MNIDKIRLEYLGHDGFLIELENKLKIVIDPYMISEDAAQEKADVILITHGHYDHCSLIDIEKLRKKNTTIIMPAGVQSKITRLEGSNMQIIESGDELSFEGLRIEATPAYNINKKFHPKKDGGIGYIIKYDKYIIYHSGDTDKIPEMERPTGYGKDGNHFITLLPVSGTYVMDYNEAAEVAEMLKPDLAIPMHYGAGVAGTEEDAENFVKACKQYDVDAQILERI